MYTIAVVKVGSTESCMECGKVGTRFRDFDGSHFCSQVCLTIWHGPNSWAPLSQIVEADHALAIAENYARSL